jgi:predicted anti-sigma-YlaC factor YlaD
VRCEDCCEAISAQLDGEDPGISEASVRDHLAGCADCRAFAASLPTLHRASRIAPADEVPDLTSAILRNAAPVRYKPWGFARTALAVVALTHLVLAVPAVITGDGGAATVHATRELAAFDIALAVGLLVSAWQPARSVGLLPLAAALALVLLGTSAADVLRGAKPIASEAHHVLVMVGLVLLWFVARDVPRGARRLRAA